MTLDTSSDVNAINLKSVRARLRTIRDALLTTFRERNQAIECMLLAALSGQHALLVGPPGTAKSMLFTSFLQSFSDVRLFARVIGKTTTEDELFGPVKLSALKNDQWERNLDGRLARVHCAFLDEVFKGGDVILNTLLPAMNEREYQGAPIPLRFVVGASNELPEGEILAAIYDRFLLRDVVDYIHDDDVWTDLIASPPVYTSPAKITLAEWDAVQKAVKDVQLPRSVIGEMAKIKRALREKDIIVSDRRWLSLGRVLKAAAWFDGVTEVDADHLTVLRYGLWQQPADRDVVNAVLNTVAQGVVRRATDILDVALKAYAARPTNRETYVSAVPGLVKVVSHATESFKQLICEATNLKYDPSVDVTIPPKLYRRIQPKLDAVAKLGTQLQEDLKTYYVNGMSIGKVKS